MGTARRDQNGVTTLVDDTYFTIQLADSSVATIIEEFSMYVGMFIWISLWKLYMYIATGKR